MNMVISTGWEVCKTSGTRVNIHLVAISFHNFVWYCAAMLAAFFPAMKWQILNIHHESKLQDNKFMWQRLKNRSKPRKEWTLPTSHLEASIFLPKSLRCEINKPKKSRDDFWRPRSGLPPWGPRVFDFHLDFLSRELCCVFNIRTIPLLKRKKYHCVWESFEAGSLDLTIVLPFVVIHFRMSCTSAGCPCRYTRKELKDDGIATDGTCTFCNHPRAVHSSEVQQGKPFHHPEKHPRVSIFPADFVASFTISVHEGTTKLFPFFKRLFYFSPFCFTVLFFSYSIALLYTPITSPYWITIRNSHSVPAVGAGNDSVRIFLADFACRFFGP